MNGDTGAAPSPPKPKPKPVEHRRPYSDTPVVANFLHNHFTLGAGVAIFHIATARVVLCYYPPDKQWFLPKGRKDVNEGIEQAAEREGFEESGYRNRLLPVPIQHRQPQSSFAKQTGAVEDLAREPVWLQLAPVTARAQYILHWFVAETVPPALEEALTAAERATERVSEPEPELEPESAAEPKAESSAHATTRSDTELPHSHLHPHPNPTTSTNSTTSTTSTASTSTRYIHRFKYEPPTPFPAELTLRQRLAMEPAGYEPVRHADTGVDADEAQYESTLLPVEDAIAKLRGSVQADVVRRGWEAIQLRLEHDV